MDNLYGGGEPQLRINLHINSFPIPETETGIGPSLLALSLQVPDKEKRNSTSHSPEQ